MDSGKRGEKPPLPRSRNGNENPKCHCHESIMMGRRVSRPPEAGRPIHRRPSRGEVHVQNTIHIIVEAVGL